MLSLTPPSALDVVRLIRPTIDETTDGLKRYYEIPPRWGYGPARAMAKPVFSGEVSMDAAVEGCRSRGNPLGRESNAEVAGLVWEAAQGRSFQCFDLSKRPFAIRQDLKFWVDPLFFFVEHGRIKIFWLQPRRGFYPTLEGVGTLAVIIRMTFIDEFDEFDLELLDLSVPRGSKERVPRTLGFSVLPLLSEDNVRAALERFAQAYDRVRDMGVQRPERHPRQSDNRRGPDLFE
jgi:hypothetical protein